MKARKSFLLPLVEIVIIDAGISVAYRAARRTAVVTGLPTVTQRSDTVGVFYNILGSGGFGAIR